MREVIEAEIGEKLEWDPNPENLDKTIGLKRDADLTNLKSFYKAGKLGRISRLVN